MVSLLLPAVVTTNWPLVFAAPHVTVSFLSFRSLALCLFFDAVVTSKTSEAFNLLSGHLTATTQRPYVIQVADFLGQVSRPVSASACRLENSVFLF